MWGGQQKTNRGMHRAKRAVRNTPRDAGVWGGQPKTNRAVYRANGIGIGLGIGMGMGTVRRGCGWGEE